MRRYLLPWFLPLGILAPLPGWAEDRQVGEAVLPASGEKRAAAKEEPPLRVLDLGSAALGPDLDWNRSYEAPPAGGLSSAAQATLSVATGDLDRKKAVAEIRGGGDRTAKLLQNLDVGRHEILKEIYARALVAANAKLKGKGGSPLKKVLSVNFGGTGDYTRDQDITVFAGDPDVEKVLFESVVEVARAPPFGLEVDLKKTGGIDFPQIEVTLFPGGNHLPDSRFATDVEAFKPSCAQKRALLFAERLREEILAPVNHRHGVSFEETHRVSSIGFADRSLPLHDPDFPPPPVPARAQAPRDPDPVRLRTAVAPR